MDRTALANYLKDIETEFFEIREERKKILKQFGDYVVTVLKGNGLVTLVFICTHNSRRSQFGEIWSKTAAQYYEIQNINAFSGGTESTAFNPRAVAALKKAGFRITKREGYTDNPHYLISSREFLYDNPMFSKKFNDKVNPKKDFCSIMVCTDADKACPIIPGASERISMPYDDPKAFDGTDQEEIIYDERCRQIAREMFFTFNYAKTCM